jgi:NADPH-dependent 2,4-dienoyl-CoA reductase/sulfur reductase-like enzyme
MTGEHALAHADVAVVGAGPAGITAAAVIAEARRRVVLLDESDAAGGQIWRHRAGAEPPSAARRWIGRLQRSGATFVGGAAVVDVRDDESAGQFEIVAERGVTPLVVRAETIVLATGARERFLPFPGWTLPGVVGVGGAQALLKGGLRVAGKRVVVAGSGPLLLPVAASLAAAGARLLLVAEQAPHAAVMRFARGLWRRPGALVQATRYRIGFRGTPYAAGTWVTSARGDGRVEEVTVTDGQREFSIPCDMLCAAYGLVPDDRLVRLLGCETTAHGVVVDERQRTSHARVWAAGETTGIGGGEQAIVQARIAAAAVLGRPVPRALVRRRASLAALAAAMNRAFALRDELRRLATPETIVCRCEDVRLRDLRPAWDTREAKLYTRVGMGACQGRVCGAALQFLRGWPADTTRPPVAPALVSTILAEPASPMTRSG